jgi:4-amino-4-deoxy-L-arabinose transferase-like glycosyltransferase
MKKPFIFLILIIALGFFLRFYHVADIPNSPLVDEASIGYNAYSILRTGKDEFGKVLPLTFKAFGDQKLPAYIYATVPSVAVFGLNNFAVRFPSVVFGTLLILVSYLLLREFKFSEPVSLIGALITATTPWMIILSRFGYESNMGLLFFTVGLFFLAKSYRNKKPIYFILAGFCFGFTWYCYIAFRLVSTALIGVFLLFELAQRSKRKISLKYLFLLFFSFVVICAPFFPTFLSTAGTARLNQISIFSNAGIPMEIIQDRTYCTESLPKLLCYTLYQKPFIYLREVANVLANTFSLSYLFLKGGDIRYVSVENFGLFIVFLLPFYIAGLIHLFRKIIAKKRTYILLACAGLIAAFPSVLVGELFSVRLTPLYPFLLLLLVAGIKELKKYKYLTAAIKTISALLIAFSCIYMVQLLTIHTKKFEDTYQTFIPDTMNYLARLDSHTDIYVENYFSEPAIYYAYYKKIDPKVYQKKIKLGPMQSNGFQHVVKLGNFNVTNHSPTQLACLHKDDQNAVILSQNKVETNTDAKPLYMYIGNTGLPSYAFIYKVHDVLAPETDCMTILKSL